MIKVVLESPFAGDVRRNIEYARACLLDSLKRGESPIASHLLLTQPGILDDTDAQQRDRGIDAGLEWVDVAEKQVFYTDYGYSEGMLVAKAYGEARGIEQEERRILTDVEIARTYKDYPLEVLEAYEVIEKLTMPGKRWCEESDTASRLVLQLLNDLRFQF